MRGTRWLILAAIFAILGGVGAIYLLQKRTLQAQAPKKPEALPLDLNSSAEDWQWTQTAGGRTIVTIRARKFGQSKDSTRVDLEKVELQIFHEDEGEYDLVRSAQAQFSPVDKRLYSEGEVEITLHVPAEGKPAHKLTSIRSSGVTFDSVSGRAYTDRPASFNFENGDGKSVGASYDPGLKELHLNSQAELNWNEPGSQKAPLKIEAGELIYKEAASMIWLLGWSRLTRGNTVIDAGNAVIKLEDGAIRRVEAQNGRGVDTYPNRELQYAADQIYADIGDDGQVQKIVAQSNARLTSQSETAVTTIHAGRVDLSFADAGGESALSQALATGKGVLESKPLAGAQPGKPVPETRVLRSNVILVKMRAGGKEMDSLETQAPGTLEFLPNSPGQRHRTLDGERMWMHYGAENRLRDFRAHGVKTVTEPLPHRRAAEAAPILTTSREMAAKFSETTGEMIHLEQWDQFEYQEGMRKGTARRATLDSAANRIVLETAARLWDPSGSTSADRITLDQRTGDMLAVGHVRSSRQPDQKKPGSDMLSGDEPLQALAHEMRAADHNHRIQYQGNVMLWQGAERLQAQTVDIDRTNRQLTAGGGVMTQFLEKPEENQTGPKETPVFTIVKAPDLVYTEQDRVAHYTGGAVLTRPGLEVQAAGIRAYLSPAGSDSRMEKALADTDVKIVQRAADRTRTGTGAHAEYYTAENKVILRGPEAVFVDSLRGETRGSELTYFAADDRLLVNGAPGQPVVSRIRRK